MMLYCPWLVTSDEELIFCGIYEDRKSAHTALIKTFGTIEHEFLCQLPPEYKCFTVCRGLSSFLPPNLSALVAQYLPNDRSKAYNGYLNHIIKYMGNDYKAFKKVAKGYINKMGVFKCPKGAFQQQAFKLL